MVRSEGMATQRSGLHQQTAQRMELSPTFLQALEVLQMGAVDLVREIEAECARNETLRIRPVVPTGGGDADHRQRLLAAVPDRPHDLLTHVEHEIGLLDLSIALRTKVLALAGLLDERGYLSEGREALAEAVGAEGLDAALEVLQALPPRGIGARGPIEAMLVQIPDDDPDRPTVETILRCHLETLAAGRRAEVAGHLGMGVEELDALLGRIRRLDPRPAARFVTPRAEPIRADVVVAVEQGRLVVKLADGSLPSLEVDRRIARLAAAGSFPPPRRRELAGKLRSARALIRAVTQRGETLLRVTSAVFSRQGEFLRRGARGIRCLRMGEVAALFELHPSTISRTVRGKAVWTPHGLFPLREFFDTAGGGPDRARREQLNDAIRACLARDARATDREIQGRLAAAGLVVARRTVAKYRALLGGPRRRSTKADRPAC